MGLSTRAKAALAGIRRAAVAHGLDRLPQRRIQEIIEKTGSFAGLGPRDYVAAGAEKRG